MQSNTRVRDTDQKEGNVMNNNPNRGSSRKDKQMIAITRRATQTERNCPHARGCGVENSALPLAKLSLGWVGAIARAYEAAGELTGAKSEAKWQQPPVGK